jgi:O-antigen/teichoic acid export membrane protein
MALDGQAQPQTTSDDPRGFSLLTGSSHLLLGYAIKLMLQASGFVLLARTLAVQEFGAFAVSLAVVSLIAPFSDLGAYNIIVQGIARGRRVPSVVGESMALTAITLPFALLAATILSFALLPQVPWQVVGAVALAAFVGARLSIAARAVFVARGDMKRSATTEVVVGGAQVCGILILSLMSGSLEQWAWLYLAQSLVAGGLLTAWVCAREGVPEVVLRNTVARIKEGIQHSFGFAAQNLYTDLDKTMLGRLATLESAGVYSAAHRIVAVAQVPMMAYVAAVFPSLCRAGERGYAIARARAERSIPVVAVYGVCAGGAVWLMSPHLSALLGPEYTESSGALRILSLVLLIQSLQYPFADALSASGLQGIRSGMQLCALAANGALNLWLIPSFGWKGAAWATVLTQLLMLCLLFCYPFLRRHAHRLDDVLLPEPARGS